MQENNFWKTPRGKAIIKLGLWLIFIFIIILLASVGSFENVDVNKEQEEKETVHFTSYPEMIDKILENNYAFKYTLNNLDETIIYNGYTDGKNTVGLKETKENIVKYYIENDKIYKVVLDELVEMNDLYTNVDTRVINLNELFTDIKEMKYQIEKEDKTRTIKYDEENITVYTSTNEITKIVYSKENINYTLEFSSIGKVSTISYK